MATIYQKTVSDKTCILAPREFLLRPFDFGDDWTEMRLGAYFCGVTSGADDTTSVAETVALTTDADRIYFGIKDSATNDLPGFGDALFLGATTRNANGSNITAGSPNNFRTAVVSGGDLSAAGFHETTVVGGGASETLSEIMNFPAASGASAYCGFFVVKFVISNRGTSSQSFAISAESTSTISGTDYSASALRLLINNATFSAAATIAWNDGAVARDIPDAVFIRMPFYNNRIRLSCIRAIRYAP